MTRYRPKNPTAVEDTQDWAQQEFAEIESAFNEQDSIRLVETNVAPVKPRTGDTYLADGTNWNPGTGQVVYTYYAGAWHKLG